ncbi:MAG TPA: calcium-binding protein [Hyphomicrobiales bacterium]|nr:calcium-binding protein [Hyphomicrobiales bacterium]
MALTAFGHEIAAAQFGSQSAGNLAVLTDGSVVLGGQSNSTGLSYQHFAADGELLGTIHVDVPPNLPFGSDAVLALSNGGFAVLFQENLYGADDIWARSYHADGTPATDFVHVNGVTDGTQSELFATATTGGGYYVDYTDTSASSTSFNPLVQNDAHPNDNSAIEDDDVRGVFVDAHGTVGADTNLVAGTKEAPGPFAGPYDATAGEQRSGAPATLDNGSVVVPYIDRDYYTFVNGPNGNSPDVSAVWAISMRIVTPTGISSVIQVDGNTLPPADSEVQAYHEARPEAVALAGGGFAVVFSMQDFTVNPAQVHTEVRFFNDDGSARTDPIILLDRDEQFVDAGVKLAALPGGGFAMGYQTVGDDHGQDTRLAIVDAQGNIQSDVSVASGGGDQTLQGLSVAADGSVYVSWHDQSRAVGSESGDFVQRYVVNADGDFVMTGGDRADTIKSTADAAHATWIDGGGGADVLTGGAGASHLYGNAGADTLRAGSGAALMDGGNGNDTYVVNSIADVVFERPDAGTDLVRSTIAYHLGANVENLTLTGPAAISGTGNGLNNTITGNGAANALSGGGGNDVLHGGRGDDTLNGGAGNDTLDGGAGADRMAGGKGNDTYVVDDPHDAVVEAKGNGIDLVRASVDFTLSRNVENLTLTGKAALDGTGNGAANVVTGNAAANHLSGAAGNDTLLGGAGNDLLDGGAGKDLLTGGKGNDIFRFDSKLVAANADHIADFAHGHDHIQLDSAVFGALTGTGTLGAAFFVENTTGKAETQDQHIIYDSQTGALLYDADGSGKGHAVQFATLDNHPATLTHADFLVA